MSKLIMPVLYINIASAIIRTCLVTQSLLRLGAIMSLQFYAASRSCSILGGFEISWGCSHSASELACYHRESEI